MMLRIVGSLLLLTTLIGYRPALPVAINSLDEGLVAHYTFNDCTGRDQLARSPARKVGEVGCWCGIEDDGLLFSGQNSSLEFSGPVNDVFTTSDFSLSFYLKNEGGGRSPFPLSLLGKRAFCDENNMFDLLLSTAPAAVKALLYEDQYRYFPDLEANLDQTAGWLHIALVRQGLYAQIYLNGVLAAESRRCRGLDIGNEQPLYFNASPCLRGGRVQPFRGILDELRIYDRALSPEEVRDIYQLTPIEDAAMDCVS